jgi:hypothetical protein
MAISHGTSQARSLLPSAGRAVNAADYACFWLDGSTMTNGCTTNKVIEIPLPTDGDGHYTVTVTAQGATTANNVGCAAFGIDRNGFAWASDDPRKFLPSFGTAQDLATRAWKWGGGGMYVNCTVDPGGRYNYVNW